MPGERWHQRRRSSPPALAFFTMLAQPALHQIRPPGQTAPYAGDVILGDRLEDDAAKLVLEKAHLRSSFNAMLPAEFHRNDKLALGGKCSTYLFHILHCTKRSYIQRRRRVRRIGVLRVYLPFLSPSSRATLSSTPLMNCTDSGVENRRA